MEFDANKLADWRREFILNKNLPDEWLEDFMFPLIHK